MAKKNSYIDTSIWNDSFFIELDAIEKLLFIYLITNAHVTYSGIYKMTNRLAGFETGIDKDSIQRILKRFEESKKIVIISESIIICNFLKYQTYNDSLKAAAKKDFESLPAEVQLAALNNPNTYSFIKDKIYTSKTQSCIASKYHLSTMPASYRHDDGIIHPSQPHDSDLVLEESLSISSALKKKSEPVVPSIDEVKEVVSKSGYPESVAIRFYELQEAVGWTTSSGQKIKDWRAFLTAWLVNEKTQKTRTTITDRHANEVIEFVENKYKDINQPQLAIVASLFTFISDEKIKSKMAAKLLAAAGELENSSLFFDYFRNFAININREISQVEV